MPTVISEKTAELNLTTELMNWMWKIHGKTFTAVAPSQRLEAKRGYDVGIFTRGFGFFIQYKRAKLRGTEYIYELNRTASKDQHQKLCSLEKPTVPVLYAFPLFTTVREVVAHRRSLLRHALWIKPSSIPVPSGGVGHHELHFDSSTKRFWVTSDDEIDFDPGDTSYEILESMKDRASNENNVMEAASSFNRIFIGENPNEIEVEVDDESVDDTSFSGLSLMASIEEET